MGGVWPTCLRGAVVPSVVSRCPGVSLMGRDEVLELLGAMDVVKAREEVRLTNSWSKVHQGIKQRRAREREAEET